MTSTENPELVRYWFGSSKNIGVGITAYSREDADAILAGAIKRHRLDVEIIEVVEGVDIRDLDQGHVFLI